MEALLSTAYLPPVSYISQCLLVDEIVLEQHEHYVKQTYRNRANIYGANGILQLIIPVQHDNLAATPIKDVKISYDSPWQQTHWRSITSAYRNSPYFEFYEDDFAPFYEQKYETLFEFNTELLKKIFLLLKAKVELEFTAGYEKTPASIADLRNSFSPDKRNENHKPYRQVFSEKTGFISDLSIIDKMFNERSEIKKINGSKSPLFSRD
jgi:hypothetical protein